MSLVAFDLDGTLLRGDTVCEVIARGIGHLDRMRAFEQMKATDTETVIAALQEMAGWYATSSISELCTLLESVELAPGVEDGLKLLRRNGFTVAIVSLTWQFAVEWLAKRLGADYFVGTRLSVNGEITHFWPSDKAQWVGQLAARLGVEMEDVVAVGDSSNDIDMLQAVGHPYWVGMARPEGLADVVHLPDGDIHQLADHILRR